MNDIKQGLSRLIFLGRWLQAPLYIGLVIVLLVYTCIFARQLFFLVIHAYEITDIQIMLHALDLIDVVMIANLLIMVIFGGYQTFVSSLNLQGHPDNPEWLDHVNAGTMKTKLALALITISSIHLLRTFMDPTTQSESNIKWQIIIHLTLLISALGIAFTNVMMEKKVDK